MGRTDGCSSHCGLDIPQHTTSIVEAVERVGLLNFLPEEAVAAAAYANAARIYDVAASLRASAIDRSTSTSTAGSSRRV